MLAVVILQKVQHLLFSYYPDAGLSFFTAQSHVRLQKIAMGKIVKRKISSGNRKVKFKLENNFKISDGFVLDQALVELANYATENQDRFEKAEDPIRFKYLRYILKRFANETFLVILFIELNI